MTNLKQVKEIDDGKSVIVLVNFNLERMTFFDRLGIGQYMDSFAPVYVMKKAANNSGYLYRSWPENWEIYANIRGEKLIRIEDSTSRPKFLDVDSKIKSAIAKEFSLRQEEIEAAKKVEKKSKDISTNDAKKSALWGF